MLYLQDGVQLNLPADRYGETLDKVYIKKFGNYNYARAVTIDGSTGDALSLTALAAESIGKAVRAGNKAGVSALADAKIMQETIPVWRDKIGYAYTKDDAIAAARYNNWNPIERRMASALEIFHRTIHDYVMTGSGKWKGLTNYGDTTGVTLATVAGTNWSEKATTNASIMRDVNAALELAMANSGGRHVPNTMLLPIFAFTALATRYHANQPGINLLETVRQAFAALAAEAGNGTEFRVVPTFSLTDKIVMYDRSDDSMLVALPQVLEFDAPRIEAGDTIVDGDFRVSPLLVFDTTGIVEITGITSGAAGTVSGDSGGPADIPADPTPAPAETPTDAGTDGGASGNDDTSGGAAGGKAK